MENSLQLQEEKVWDDQIDYTVQEPEIGNAYDMVNRPAHYMSKSGIESIDVIESFDLNYNLGNATKYLLRAGKKWNKNEDLEKAIWYINREIQQANK